MDKKYLLDQYWQTTLEPPVLVKLHSLILYKNDLHVNFHNSKINLDILFISNNTLWDLQFQFYKMESK